MENKDKREGWLRELKVGDEIAIECGSYGYRNYRIVKIDKITPTGRIIIGDSTYDHTGRQMGVAGSWTKANSLEPVTQKIIDFLRRQTLCNEISKINWEKVSLDMLEGVKKLLEEERNK